VNATVSTESKEYALSQMDSAWAAFAALLDRVPEDEYDRPGITNEWCLKELLGHVVFWAEKAAHDVNVSAAGKPEEAKSPGGLQNVDELNAEAAARGKAMTAAEAKAAAARAHESARKAFAEAPESALAPVVSGWTVGKRAAEDTYIHYSEHAEQIKAWLREMETTEK
jgi:hypothetical protein